MSALNNFLVMVCPATVTPTFTLVGTTFLNLQMNTVCLHALRISGCRTHWLKTSFPAFSFP